MKNTSWKKISISLIIIGVFLVSVQSGSSLQQKFPTQSMATKGWLYVGGGGSGNYTTIQSAINDASDGDTVFVYAGTYHENINITSSLELIGEGRTITTIKGNNLLPTVNIYKQNILVQGFTIKNDGTQRGIETETSSSQHQFRNNIITLTSRGINLYYSSENAITGNLIYDNTDTGVYADIGQNTTIFNNEIYNNTVSGIYLSGCGDVYIENNTITKNGKGIYGYANNRNRIYNNIIESNSIGILLSGAFTLNSNYNMISHNRINNNTICGIQTEHSQLNIFEFNEIKENGKGIDMYYTFFNTIRDNVIAYNDVMDITLSYSIADRITRNNIENTQESLVVLQINFGFSIAANNWWGSAQWPLRRIRPILGWMWILPWRPTPFDLSMAGLVV